MRDVQRMDEGSLHGDASAERRAPSPGVRERPQVHDLREHTGGSLEARIAHALQQAYLDGKGEGIAQGTVRGFLWGATFVMLATWVTVGVIL